MLICGIQKLSLLDYPGKIAATIFTGGCNFRCGFCHNAQLVTDVTSAEVHHEDEILDFLARRTGKLDGICITGGEPLLQSDLASFIKKVRAMGFSIKLDTNGAFPDKLASLLSDGLVDYIAMDIKNSEEKYPLTIGIPGFDVAPIKKSIGIIISSGVDYEFRTTLVKGLHDAGDMPGIGELIRGAKAHYLQNFIDSGDLVGFRDTSAPISMSGFTRPEVEHFQGILAPYVGLSAIRGMD